MGGLRLRTHHVLEICQTLPFVRLRADSLLTATRLVKAVALKVERSESYRLQG